MTLHQANALAIGIKFTVIDCASCGILFAITADLEERRREDGQSFSCPNGHPQHFTASELDRAKKRIKTLEEEIERKQRRYAQEKDARERTERSLAATKGQVTKLRKTITAGLCPYGCRRHFTNLERHISSKHPGKHLPAEASVALELRGGPP